MDVFGQCCNTMESVTENAHSANFVYWDLSWIDRSFVMAGVIRGFMFHVILSVACFCRFIYCWLVSAK